MISSIKTKLSNLKTFFLGFGSDAAKAEHLSLQKYKTQTYIDFDLPVEKKIEQEKRRRHQAYMRLDYLLSVVTYFDFFSVDAFSNVKKAKDLTQFFEKRVVTSDILLLPFFESNANREIIALLEKYGVNKKEILEKIYSSQKLKPNSLKEKLQKSIKNLLLKIDIPMISEALVTPKATSFSYEINQIFEKAAENAITRFKTPVISSEILLITMLEAKNTKAGKLLKKALKTELQWYTLRYGLMKRLHYQELCIRRDVPENYQYFAYLLKIHLPEYQFETLLDKDCLVPGVLLFRNTLIIDSMELDLYKEIRKDIFSSIKATTTRDYSKGPLYSLDPTIESDKLEKKNYYTDDELESYKKKQIKYKKEKEVRN